MLTEDEERKIGEALVSMLDMKPRYDWGIVPRYHLSDGYGTKTALGVYRVIESIINKKGES